MPAAEQAGPLSHDRYWHAGVVQSICPPGRLDLERGYLEPALLPVDLLAGAYAGALAEFGAAALSYGADAGALAMRTELAARADGVACTPEHVLLTAGTSHALQFLAGALARPGDTVLVEQVSYDLGRRVLTDCGLRLRAVPMDAEGMCPAALDAALAGDDRVAFVVLTPSFHNPTGLLMPAARRRDLLAVAAAHGVLVLEDDAYRDVRLDDAEPVPSLAGLAGCRGVLQLRTFSKSVAPGLRLGWLLGEPELIARLAGHGMFVSGGSANHVTSLAMTELLRSGGYDKHLRWLRERLRERRDALTGALRAGLPADVTFHPPAGGFFVWLRGTGRNEASLLAAAGRAGLAVAAGSRFGHTRTASVRLAYSFNPPDRLAGAGTRLADALTANRKS